MTTKIIVALIFAIVILGSGWSIDRANSKIATQQLKIDQLSEESSRKSERLNQEIEWGKTREGVISVLLTVSTDIEQMQTTIREQNRVQAKALRELIENDKIIGEYMRTSIPANLGLQYERTETTDPTTYGPASSGSVPTGTMPTTRENSTEKQ